jgi:hypothetical protein
MSGKFELLTVVIEVKYFSVYTEVCATAQRPDPYIPRLPIQATPHGKARGIKADRRALSRAHTPLPLAAARPKLQLGSVRAWRCRAAPLPAWISWRWRRNAERLSCSKHSGWGRARSTGMPMHCRAAASCAAHDYRASGGVAGAVAASWQLTPNAVCSRLPGGAAVRRFH